VPRNEKKGNYTIGKGRRRDYLSTGLPQGDNIRVLQNDKISYQEKKKSDTQESRGKGHPILCAEEENPVQPQKMLTGDNIRFNPTTRGRREKQPDYQEMKKREEDETANRESWSTWSGHVGCASKGDCYQGEKGMG